tara:strand:- start:12627 stop:13664 length:1038 start_codon:yes stop_codon:yes gene_type:complete
MKNTKFISHLNILEKIKKILFNNLFNSLLSLLLILSLGSIITFTIKWIIFDSSWKVITSNLPLFAFGSFPKSERWRPAIWMISLLTLCVLTLFGPKYMWLRKNIIIGWILTLPLGFYLLYGGAGLPHVMSRNWGGLTLTIFLTIGSSFFSLPLGILLALSRKSSLPIIKKFSAIYIDSMRSIPLIAVLFFGQLLIPLFLPFGLEIDRVWRAILAYTLFLSAYIAEDIRGGLQAIPKTQIESANSLGLNKYQINKFILIPQSLIIALPALTNQSIGLFQNTSLMAILGLLELIGVGRSVLANPEFIGQYIEVYIWLATVYWLFCTIIAIIGRHLEQTMIKTKSNFF